MTDQKPTGKKKKTPLGKNLDWSERDLQDLADISPADLLAAQALWEKDAPQPLKGLLKAKVEEDQQHGTK